MWPLGDVACGTPSSITRPGRGRAPAQAGLQDPGRPGQSRLPTQLSTGFLAGRWGGALRLHTCLRAYRRGRTEQQGPAGEAATASGFGRAAPSCQPVLPRGLERTRAASSPRSQSRGGRPPWLKLGAPTTGRAMETASGCLLPSPVHPREGQRRSVPGRGGLC